MVNLITASDGKYKEILTATLAKAIELGYDKSVYDLGELGFGTKLDISQYKQIASEAQMKRWHSCKPAAYAKPLCMQMGMLKHPGENAVWIDADALLIGGVDSCFHSLEDNDWDVGLTSKIYWTVNRPPRLNTGAVYLRGTGATMEFLAQWIKKIETGPFAKSDQHHLQDMIGTGHKIGETWRWNGVRIKWLPECWNVCVQDMDLLDEHLINARVLHFFRKDGVKRYKEWLENQTTK